MICAAIEPQLDYAKIRKKIFLSNNDMLFFDDNRDFL